MSAQLFSLSSSCFSDALKVWFHPDCNFANIVSQKWRLRNALFHIHWYFSHSFYSNMLLLSVPIHAGLCALSCSGSVFITTNEYTLFHHKGILLRLCRISAAARMWTAPWPFNSLDKGMSLIFQTVVQLSSLKLTADARSYRSHIDDTSIWNTWVLQQKHSREEGMNKRGRGVEWGKFGAGESTCTGVVHGLPPPPVPPVVRPR